MSYGIQAWGLGSWGGSDFSVTNHVPFDNSTGNLRLTTISFTLFSQSGAVDAYSINLTANGIYLVQDGYFTDDATGAIDLTNPSLVNVVATVTHAFDPLELVLVEVSAINATSVSPSLGTTWQFTVNDTQYNYINYISNRFEKVLRVGITGLDAPSNPDAIVDLDPPDDFEGETE